MNKELSPKITSSVARSLHQHEDFAWRLFARRIQKHPFVKAVLIQQHLAKGCAWCGRPFASPGSVQLHHVDYDHACKFKRTVELATPTPKRPDRKFKGPDCRRCRQERPSYFESCVSRLVLTHKLCNRDIANTASD